MKKSKQNKNERSDSQEALKRRRASLFKIGAVMILAFIVWVFSSIAWFSMNKENSASGMGVKTGGMPYTIQTRSESSYYKGKWDKIGSDAMEWQVSSGKNFDNHGSDLDVDEDEPGLEPGDSGMLEFRVQPNAADSITVDCVFDFKAYLETPVLANGEPVLDENNDPVTNITEVDNATLLGYVKTHIMLFSEYDTSTGKYSGLIVNDEDLRKVLANQTYTKNGTTYTTLYWKWPMHLEDLTSDNTSTLIYDPTERTSVIDYIATNKDGFFKDCNDSAQKVRTDLTSLATTYDNQVYNHYNMRYDNADLDIGNNISYVLLSMNVEMQSG